MSKKQGKDTFRNTKKNVLHKKKVNSKKRGLRGGMFRFGSSSSSPVTKLNTYIDTDGTLHGIRGKYSLTSLNEEECENYMAKINIYEKDGKQIKLVPGSSGIKDYNECLKKLNRAVTFDTSLTTGMSTTPDPKTLTLRGCKAIKKGIIGTSNEFKYEIFSPAETTKPPNGGIPGETLVGTFTQLPISVLLKLAKQEQSFNFYSFYDKDERKSYFTDYLSCLENVKQNYGQDDDPLGSQSEKFRPLDLSELSKFGKSDQCRIVLVAGNVGTQIQNPDNDGAIFSFASQGNAAEYQSPQPVTDLNKYKEDNTAGPLAQLSCHPAVAEFILQHAARKLPNGENFTSKFLVINAVDSVISGISSIENDQKKAGLSLNNGYLEVKGNNNSGDFTSTDFKFYTDDYSSDVYKKRLSDMANNIFYSFCEKLKVLQTDDVPTSGLRPPPKNRKDPEGYKEFNSNATSKVSLIYSSAVPLNYVYSLPTGVRAAINPQKSLLQYCVAGFNLVAQYFGAMVSAYNKSKKMQTRVKLFLTPLGGGVFKNPREMIACSALLAYYQAQQLFTDFDDSVEVIFLVWDGNSDEVNDFGNFFNTKQANDSPQVLETEAAVTQQEQPEAQGAQGEGGVSPQDAPPNVLRRGDGDGDDDHNPTLPPKSQNQDGGHKSRHRHRHVHKTRRGRKSKSKSKPHKRQHNMQKRTRKHKRYTSRKK